MTFYFQDVIGDHDWGNVANWWTNTYGDTPAGALPTADDDVDVFTSSSITQSTAPAICKNLTANGSSLSIDITIHGNAVFASGSSSSGNLTITGALSCNFISSISGNITCASASFYTCNNGAYITCATVSFTSGATNAGGTVLGAATFNDTSTNESGAATTGIFNNTYLGNKNGTVSFALFDAAMLDDCFGSILTACELTENCQIAVNTSWNSNSTDWIIDPAVVWTFAEGTYNNSVAGNSIFNVSSYNNGSVAVGTFNASSYNGSMGNAVSATFKDIAHNAGTIYTDAEFQGTSYNVGAITGNAIFRDSAYNTEAPGTIGGTATFYDSSFNKGTITGIAYFYNTAVNLASGEGCHCINAYFYDTSGNMFDVDAGMPGRLIGDGYFYGSTFNRGVIEGDMFILSKTAFNCGNVSGINGVYGDIRYNFVDIIGAGLL